MTRREPLDDQVPVTSLGLFDRFARNAQTGRLTLQSLVGGCTEQELRDDGYEQAGCGFFKDVTLQDRGEHGGLRGCQLQRYLHDDTEFGDGVELYSGGWRGLGGPRLTRLLAHHLRENGPFTMTLWGDPLREPTLDEGVLVLDGRLSLYFREPDFGRDHYLVWAINQGVPGGREHLTLTSPVMSKAIRQVAFQRFVAFLHRSGLQLA